MTSLPSERKRCSSNTAARHRPDTGARRSASPKHPPFRSYLLAQLLTYGPCPSCCRAIKTGELRQRNMLWIISLFIAPTKSFPTSSGISISRDVASRARCRSAAKGSGISLIRSSPSWRMTSSTLNEGGSRAAPFAWAVCARPRPEPGRRRLMPRLEHLTCRAPRITPDR
jgi:hypothetical protein